jgi:asparagine synthase (glutamine-hydrolysing)
MCGIAGGVFWGGRIDGAAAERAIARMVDALGHRGPDGRGMMASAPAAGSASATAPFAVFGHTRLAILDISPLGAQPMGAPDSTFITYNGESYHFADLRATLEREGAAFASGSDTEVLLRGYERWGIDILSRADGMFAFGVWDQRQQRLLLARDRLGIKPLYFFKGDGLFLFASEVRALLATDLVPRRLDRTALWQYLGSQSVPAPRTLVEGVRALPPARWMTVSGEGAIAEGEYWHMLDAASRPLDVSAPEARQRVRERLREAVAAHMVSDVPVAAFLSGGIDSSAIVALMRETGFTPRTFSIGFREQAFDEAPYAQIVADRFATEHTHIELTADDLLGALPNALRAMDQPTGDAVNTFVIAGAVRARGFTVAQSGLGGDEVFGGYPSFARLGNAPELTRLWGRSPHALRGLVGSAVRTIGRHSVQSVKAGAALASDGRVSSMFPLLRQLWSPEQRQAILDPRVLDDIADRSDPYERLLADSFEQRPLGVFAQVSFAEARTYMHDVLLRDTDQMSMAHALEVRVPLLDHRLVELVMALPDSVKVGGAAPKPLLVAALGDLLPAEIVHRPKQGFVLPFAPWMRGPLRSLCEARLGAGGLSGRGLIRPQAVAAAWQSFLGGGRDVSWSRLWSLVVLDSWLEANSLGV